MRLEPLADEGADAEAAGAGETVEIELPAEPAGRAPRPSGSSAACRTCAACCSASTSTRRTASGCCPATWPPGPSSAAGRCRGEVGPADGVRRPVGAEPQQAGRRARGRAGQPGAQPARVLPQLPAEPRRRAGRRHRELPGQARRGCSAHYGIDDLDRTPELEAAVFRIFLAQQRMSADVAVVSELLRQWLAGAPPPESLQRARRARPGAPGRGHPGALPGGVATWPAAWCSAGSPSRCCAATAPRSTPRSAPTCATSTATRTRRTAPSGSRPWWPAPSRWSG